MDSYLIGKSERETAESALAWTASCARCLLRDIATIKEALASFSGISGTISSDCCDYATPEQLRAKIDATDMLLRAIVDSISKKYCGSDGDIPQLVDRFKEIESICAAEGAFPTSDIDENDDGYDLEDVLGEGCFKRYAVVKVNGNRDFFERLRSKNMVKDYLRKRMASVPSEGRTYALLFDSGEALDMLMLLNRNALRTIADEYPGIRFLSPHVADRSPMLYAEAKKEDGMETVESAAESAAGTNGDDKNGKQ